MSPSKHSRNNNNLQSGFAPIWIILFIFILGGVAFLGRNDLFNRSSGKNTGTTTASPSSAQVKPKSLLDFCKLEIQNLPKLPFTYEKIIPTGTTAEQYRKDRIKDRKSLQEYAGCGLKYSTINIIEKTYASMGLEYYKTDGKSRWENYTSIKQMPKNIDNVYGEILQKQGWVRQTKEGGENLAFGLPTLIFYKDMGDKNYYIDIVVGPEPASLYLLIVNKP